MKQIAHFLVLRQVKSELWTRAWLKHDIVQAAKAYKHRMTHTFRMPSKAGTGMEVMQYEEILLPNIDVIDPERSAKYVQAFQYQDGDILQCSYPKSGFHWFGNMTWKLKSLQPTDRPRDGVLEGVDQNRFDIQKRPRIICSHFHVNRLYPVNIENKGRIVLILRNPKDVCVSLYHHLEDTALFNNKQTLDEFFDSFMSGQIPFGSYFRYLNGWEKVLKDVADGKNHLQVEVFYFEDFLQNPKVSLARLNTYLGFNRDEEYLETVLKETTFSALRDRYLNPDLKNPFTIDADGNSIIFRKGKVGDWKSHLTVAQSGAIEDKITQTLQLGLIKFKYEI